MDGLRTRAQLVAFDPARAGAGAVGTILPRAEIAETAAQGEFPATLLLELERPEPDSGAGAQATVAVDWDEETLEQLLASTDDEAIALWFDERELAGAFDDVEGHGLRQKAAVLAVAAAAAGATAASSHAGTVEPAGQRLGAVTASQQSAGPAAQPMGVERGLQQDAEISAAMNTPRAPSTAPSSSDSSLPTGEIAGIAGAAGILLISAAGFGVARKRAHPVQPA